MKKLLAYIIDDDPVVLQILESMLENIGFTALSFTNSKNALELLNKAATTSKDSPDLIMLDFMLGEDNGVEVLQQIRQIKSCEDLAVVMLSSNSPDELPPAKYNQADAFLQKPFTTDSLKSVLLELSVLKS